MAGTLDGGDAGEGAAVAGADGSFGVEAVGDTDAGADAAVPAGDEAAGVLAAGAETGEPERAGAAVGAGVGTVGIEVRVLVLQVGGGHGDVVADAVVDGEFPGDAEVILGVEAVVGEALRDVANGFRPAEERIAEQEGGKGAAAAGREGGGAGDGGAEEVEVGAARDVLLAETIGILLLEGEAELEGMGAADVAQVVLQAPTRLIGAVVGGAAPAGELREVDGGEVLVAVDDVGDADLTLPVFVHVGREAVLREGVFGERQVVDHAGVDGPIVGDAVGFGVPGLELAAPEGLRQAGGAGGAGLAAELGGVPQEAHAVVGAEHLVAFDGPLIGRGDFGAAGDQIVLADVAARAGGEAAVRGNGRAEAGDGGRGAGEAVGGDLVTGEDIADAAGAGGVGPGGGGVVDGDQAVGLIDPVAEVAAVHLRGRHGQDDIVGANTIAESFVGDKEEGLVAAVIEFRNADRAGERPAEVVLAVDGAAGGEETASVHGIVAEEVVNGAVDVVGAGLGGEGHDAAARLAIFGFEAVGIDGKLGETFDGGGIEGGFGGVAGAVGADGVAVEGRVPCRRLAAAEREALAVAARFGRHGDQIKGAAHGAGDNERQFIDEFVLHLGADFGRVGLDGRGIADHLNLFGDLTELQLQFEPDRRRGRDYNILLHIALKAGGRNRHAVRTGNQVRGRKLSGGRSEHFECGIGVPVDDNHLGGGNRGAGLIRDRTSNQATLTLGETQGGDCSSKKAQMGDTRKHTSKHGCKVISFRRVAQLLPFAVYPPPQRKFDHRPGCC